jgi:preprotein translocase subunit SecY
MEAKRRFQFSLRTLFVVVTLFAFLASCLVALGVGSPGFWSPFGGELQFVVVLVAAIVLIGGGAILTWLVAPISSGEPTSSHDEDDASKPSSDDPTSEP